MSATRRPTTLQRRRSSGAGGPRLGAVKLSPLGAAGSDAGSPCSTASDASAMATPQDRSPLVVGRGGGVALPAAADGLAQFSHQLTATRSSDRWLEERLVSSSGRGGTSAGPGSRRQQSGSAASPAQAVEPAASQIVSKALRFITGDGTPPPPRPTSFDSTSFLDKGMDAISGVGKLMEGFAITLDHVIGQAFEEWNADAPPGTAGGSARKAAASRRAAAGGGGSSGGSALTPSQPRAALRAAAAQPAADWADKENAVGGGGGAGGGDGAQRVRQGAPRAGTQTAAAASLMSKLDAASEQEVAEWRKRAQQLAGELQRMRAQQEEYQRLRLQYEKLQGDLESAASQASRLAQENSALKCSGGPGVPPGPDPWLADPTAAAQVAKQMEALLSEKCKLAAENDRLLRENNGLQELLEFSLVHQAQLAGDDELFGEMGLDQYGEEGGEAGAQVLPPAGGGNADGGGGPAAVPATA